MYSALSRALPEGGTKHTLRVMLLRSLGAVRPIELNVNPGDTLLMVGNPNPERIARLARTIGPQGRVVIIEAHPDNASAQRKSAEKRELGNVEVIEKAASSKPGRGRFLEARWRGDHRLVIDDIIMDNDFQKDPYRGEAEVEIDMLDNILPALGVDRVDFAEITVNGAELEVLKGGAKVLDRISRIFVKAHARYKDSERTLRPEVEALLNEHGFRTLVTARTKSSADPETGWTIRDGDVYGWR